MSFCSRSAIADDSILPKLFEGTLMSRTTALCVLFLAAILEAGGDALIRVGLHAHPGRTRIGFLSLGALVLFSYGYSVNTPQWDFGKLLGIYVVFFFVVAQLISWLAFNQPPHEPGTWAGRSLSLADSSCPPDARVSVVRSLIHWSQPSNPSRPQEKSILWIISRDTGFMSSAGRTIW
jgi:hypothetical protein